MRCFALAVVVLGTVSGCVTPVSTMASHTLAVGPDSDQDVVWVVTGGDLQRCTAVQNKPVCTRVAVSN
jgi:hypothetical protein